MNHIRFNLALILISVAALVALPNRSAQSTSSNCEAEGNWNFGTGNLGSADDQKSPFIDDAIEGTCQEKSTDKIAAVHQFADHVPKSLDKIAIFSIGVPAVGKSSALDSVLSKLGQKRENFVLIDPDAIRLVLPQYKEKMEVRSELCPFKFRSYAKATVWCYNAGWELVYAVHNAALEGEKNFVHDSSCKAGWYCIEKMKEAKEKGYKIYVYGAWAPQEKVLPRALKRAHKTGRWLYPEVIKTFYNAIEENKDLPKMEKIALESGGGAFVFDTSVDHAEPTLVHRSTPEETGACSGEEPACKYFY